MINTQSVSEEERLRFLHSLEFLDTLPENEFDTLTQLASKLMNAPVSIFSIIDENRQWFKSKVGVEVCETPRNVSFCSHAIKQTDIFTVENADLDPMFADNPLVTAKEQPIKFYSGVPIVLEGKFAIGTLCVIDHQPRVLTSEEKEHLKNLAKQVEKLIELHLMHLRAKKQEAQITKQYERLKDFAGVISHDMKMPLANLILTSDIIKQKYSSVIDNEGIIYLNYLKNSSLTLSDYITNILRYYETDSAKEQPKTTFDMYELLEEVFEMLRLDEKSNVTLPEDNMMITATKSVLEQVFINLITNALKYNDKDMAEIDITGHEDEITYQFSVSDNGMGIKEDQIDLIFNLYETLGNKDNKGNKGHGIGLSMVKKICNNLGGDITVSSELGKGTCFKFWIAK